jgi:hypothetical protein
MQSMLERLENRTLFSSPHFLSGPTFIDNGTTLEATGTIAGLGNQNVTVVLDAQGTATILWHNPAGNVAPGQTKNVDVSGQQTITNVKNGRISFDVTTTPPTAPTSGGPNGKWTAQVTDVTFNSATLIVSQGGQTVLTATQTF